MRHVQAPDMWDNAFDSLGVFLAGGITECPDWQAEAVQMFADHDVTVLNPRRSDWKFKPGSPEADQTSRRQIEWEHSALDRADVILFWFPASASPQPIALYELGCWVGATRFGKPVAVGCDPRYSRRFDVETQLELARPGLAVHNTLADTVERARWLLERARLPLCGN